MVLAAPWLVPPIRRHLVALIDWFIKQSHRHLKAGLSWPGPLNYLACSGRGYVILLCLGLVFRLAGLGFNGQYDLTEIIYDWGKNASLTGLGETFKGVYGPLSYLCAEWSYRFAELYPRFWWAFFKGLEVVFELGVCLLLGRIVGPRQRAWTLYLYWLNPWFIIHGGWHGFWDGPHTFFGLAAVVALNFRADWRGWFLCGAMLMTSRTVQASRVRLFRFCRRYVPGFQLPIRSQAAALLSFWAGHHLISGRPVDSN